MDLLSPVWLHIQRWIMKVASMNVFKKSCISLELSYTIFGILLKNSVTQLTLSENLCFLFMCYLIIYPIVCLPCTYRFDMKTHFLPYQDHFIVF